MLKEVNQKKIVRDIEWSILPNSLFCVSKNEKVDDVQSRLLKALQARRYKFTLIVKPYEIRPGFQWLCGAGYNKMNCPCHDYAYIVNTCPVTD